MRVSRAAAFAGVVAHARRGRAGGGLLASAQQLAHQPDGGGGARVRGRRALERADHLRVGEARDFLDAGLVGGDDDRADERGAEAGGRGLRREGAIERAGRVFRLRGRAK